MVQTRRSKARTDAEVAESPVQAVDATKENSKKRKRQAPASAAETAAKEEEAGREPSETGKLPLRAKGGGVKTVFSDHENDNYGRKEGSDDEQLSEEQPRRDAKELKTPATKSKKLQLSTTAPQEPGDITTPTPSKQIYAEAFTQFEDLGKLAKEAAEEEENDSDSDEAPEAITQSSAKAARKAASRTQNEAITSSSALDKSKRKAKSEKLQVQAQAAQKRKEKRKKKEEAKIAKALAVTGEEEAIEHKKKSAEDEIDPENLPDFLPASILEAAAAAESRALTTLTKQPTKRKFNDDDDEENDYYSSVTKKRGGGITDQSIVLPYEKQAALSKKVVQKGESVFVKILDNDHKYGRHSGHGDRADSLAPRMKKGGATKAREKWLMGRGAVARAPVNAGFVRR